MSWFREFIKDYAVLTKDLYDGLKGNKEWNWSLKMEKSFVDVKTALREARNLRLPDYNKKFTLKTDASNSGLGAVLLQEDVKGRLLPIQWISKKLTPTEERYTITEKEMLAIKWAIERFEYELKGKKFHLITDHRALESIRTKSEFGNHRVNRWIEKIQQFDFSIEYRKGEELVTADALSRIYEESKSKPLKDSCDVNKKSKSIKDGKWNKHVVELDGNKYWRFDTGLMKKIPEITERKKLIIDTHEKLLHRSTEAVYYELKKDVYWPNIKKSIEEIIKECKTCITYNRKKKGRTKFIKTTRKFQKVAMDIADIGCDKYLLVIIDYFTRYCKLIVLNDKSTRTICECIMEYFKSGIKVEEFVTDNGKEFTSKEFENLCFGLKIIHNKVGVEAHSSNGRVERVIGTVKEGLIKNQTGSIQERIELIEKKYNSTYHSAIKCTPEEALKDISGIARLENGPNGKYCKIFKERFREKFKIGQQVKIAKHENLRENSKVMKGRFIENGVVIEICGNDTYLVKKESGKIQKKRHCDLKGMKFLCETPSTEGDVI